MVVKGFSEKRAVGVDEEVHHVFYSTGFYRANWRITVCKDAQKSDSSYWQLVDTSHYYVTSHWLVAVILVIGFWLLVMKPHSLLVG